MASSSTISSNVQAQPAPGGISARAQAGSLSALEAAATAIHNQNDSLMIMSVLAGLPDMHLLDTGM